MRSTFYRPRTLTIMLGMMFLLIFCTVTFAQTEPAGYIPLRLASGTFDPLQTAPETLSIPSALRNSSSSAYYIVQFTGPITDMDKAELTAAGADILTYIPDYAFIVRANAPIIDALANLENFRWAGAYLPYFRLSPELRTRYVETSAPTELLELVLLLPPDVDETAVTQAINEWGGSVTAHASTHWKITLRINVSSDYLIDLATLPDVQWIEPYYSPQLYNSRAVEITNAETIWDTHGLYGEGQIVAVADSGFDQGSASFGSMHPDFSDGSGGSRVLAIYDTIGDGNVADDADSSGHGTHVSGTVLGNGLSSNSGSTASSPTTNSFSNSTDAGAAPKANLVFQALWNNTTDQLLTPADLNTLFIVPYSSNGARIHTNSWGSAVDGVYTSSARDVDEFTWDHPDMLILYSAGNDGADVNTNGVVDLDSIGSPGTAKNALTVGASENNRPSLTTTYGAFSAFVSAPDPLFSDRYADDVNGMAAFSSRGYTDDGRVKPDIVAPGTAIFSTCAAVTGMGCSQGDYIYLSGTSMSTPHVAGAAALTREYFVTAQTITPSGSLLKATLLNGATDIEPGQYGTGATQEITLTRPSPQAGWGRLNLEQSLFRADPYRTWFWDVGSTATIGYPWDGLQSGSVVSYTFAVVQTGNISATLVWNDYPGSPNKRQSGQ
ncbi:MAG: S8 family serine peptidase [Chloroflexota bacterium]